MTDPLFVFLCFGVLIAGLLSSFYLNQLVSRFSWVVSSFVKSLVYALFFGIGIVGGGNSDPGFALPVPILPGAFITNKEQFIINIIIPFCVWVVIFFLFFLARLLFARIHKKGNS